MKERIHHKTETWWLIEADSPCVYMARNNWLTTEAWSAHHFHSREDAEEFLERYRYQWDSEVGKKDWKIYEHLFYVGFDRS